MKINCIAIDDEPLALEKMKDYIGRIGYLQLCELFDNAVDAMEYLKNNQVDLIFLDIQMDDFTGIEFLESIHEKPEVILTTAYDSYALKGYELDVTDYLLKPISFKRFVKAVDKVFDRLSPKKGKINKDIKPTSTPDQDGFVFIKTEYRRQKVSFDEILFIEGMKDYIRIWTEKERIMTLMSFDKIMEFLPSNNFVRVHKSFVVALDKIENIERNKIKITNESIPIGETYKRIFYQILEDRNLI